MEDLLDRLTRIHSFGDAEKGSFIWYEAIARRKVAAESWGGTSFFRLDKNVKTLGRGTVLSDDGIIRDYPHINRVVHLENGIGGTSKANTVSRRRRRRWTAKT